MGYRENGYRTDSSKPMENSSKKWRTIGDVKKTRKLKNLLNLVTQKGTGDLLCVNFVPLSIKRNCNMLFGAYVIINSAVPTVNMSATRP